MGPSSSSENEEVVCKYGDVQGLVNEESMPSFYHKLIVVEHHDTENNLWDDDANTGTDCNPPKDVYTSNGVTLRPGQLYSKALEGRPTNPLEIFFGARMAVQWY